MTESQVEWMCDRAAELGEDELERMIIAALEGRLSLDSVVDILVDVAKNDERYAGVAL